jgi:hypothetical protein
LLNKLQKERTKEKKNEDNDIEATRCRRRAARPSGQLTALLPLPSNLSSNEIPVPFIRITKKKSPAQQNPIQIKGNP